MASELVVQGCGGSTGKPHADIQVPPCKLLLGKRNLLEHAAIGSGRFIARAVSDTAEAKCIYAFVTAVRIVWVEAN